MISFTANIKINPNIYKGLDGEDLQHVQKLVQDTVDFMEIPKIRKATENDFLEIAKSPLKGYKDGHNIRLTFDNKKYPKPIEIDFCGFKPKQLKTGAIYDQIFLYLHNVKFGMKQKLTSTHESIQKEVIQRLLDLSA